MLTALENKLVFFPCKYPLGNWQPPGLKFHDTQFVAQDGVLLHAWYCPCPADREHPWGQRERPVVLYFHGNAGNLSDRASNIAAWQGGLGVDVFIFDYRGYGKSESSPSETGLYLDGQAAYRWLTKQRGVEPSRIVFLGRSLGGAVASKLALEVDHRCMILESTFRSLPDVAAQLYPWLPVRWLMKLRFATADRIGEYHKPVLITHGTHDSLIPIEHARRLFELANEPKSMVEIAGADHNDVAQTGGKRYFHEIEKFLRASLNHT